MRVPRRSDAREFRLISGGNGIIGWIRRDVPEEIFADLLRDPDGVLSASSSQVLKNVPKATVIKRVLDGGAGIAREVTIKCFRPGTTLRRLGCFVSESPALRCLRGALLLKKAGIQTPPPLAAFERRNWENLGTSYYVSEEITGGQSLRALLRWWTSELPQEEGGALKLRLLEHSARLVYRLHASGIYHPDLKSSNILVRGWAGAEWELFLVDLDGVTRRRWLLWSRKVKNLVQLCRIRRLSAEERIYFLRRYSDLFSLSEARHVRLSRKVLALSRSRRAARQAAETDEVRSHESR